MSQRIFCDRCEKEIESVAFKLKAATAQYDLCPLCEKSFKDWMEKQE